jgi:uncharacterized protein YaiL (DUF2058 family)
MKGRKYSAAAERSAIESKKDGMKERERERSKEKKEKKKEKKSQAKIIILRTHIYMTKTRPESGSFNIHLFSEKKNPQEYTHNLL